MSNLYENNCIEKNLDDIDTWMEMYGIKYHVIMYEGRDAITATHNGRSYMIVVDKKGVIHLKSEKFVRNRTRKNHWDEKKVKFRNWVNLCHSLSTRHKTYNNNYTIKPKKGKRGLKYE